MDNFTTVFLFTEDKSMLADMQFDVIIGVIVLVAGIGMILTAAKQPKWLIAEGWEKLWFPGIFATFWGIIWFSTSVISLTSYTQRYDMFVNIYKTQKYEIAEGKVHVISVQPAGGHAPGDNILIDGVQFEINYYSGDFGYERSVAHRGVLTENKYVKVFYYDGRILRIDLAQQ